MEWRLAPRLPPPGIRSPVTVLVSGHRRLCRALRTPNDDVSTVQLEEHCSQVSAAAGKAEVSLGPISGHFPSPACGQPGSASSLPLGVLGGQESGQDGDESSSVPQVRALVVGLELNLGGEVAVGDTSCWQRPRLRGVGRGGCRDLAPAPLASSSQRSACWLASPSGLSRFLGRSQLGRDRERRDIPRDRDRPPGLIAFWNGRPP